MVKLWARNKTIDLVDKSLYSLIVSVSGVTTFKKRTKRKSWVPLGIVKRLCVAS